MNNSTQITYEKVRSDAEKIKECSAVMENIFGDFERTMKSVGAPDVFAGDASESLETRFAGLKTKFNDYVKLVDEFAAMITAASEATETTEKSIENDASTLAG